MTSCAPSEFENNLKMIEAPDGFDQLLLSTITDIHEQKLRENQLRHQATMLNNISDVIITTDLEHHVLSLNNVAEAVFGVTSDAIRGKFLYNELVFDFGKSRQEVLAEFMAKDVWKGEVCITDKKGSEKYFLFTTTYFMDSEENKTAIMGVGRDITEWKKVDEKLLASEQFYRSLIADSANGMLITEMDGTLKYASNAAHTILGYDPDEVLGTNCFQFIHPDDQQIAMDSFQRELKDDPIAKSIEVRLRKKNGEWLWCLIRANNLMHNPYVQGVVIYFHDDTLQKKASDALKESEHRFRTLIRDIQVGVVLLDAEAKVLLSNKAINEIFLFGNEDIVGKSLYSFGEDITDEKGGQFTMTDCPIYQAVKNKTQVNDVVMGVYRPQSKDRVWIMMNADPIFDINGEVVQIICSVKDISERKKLEEKLLDEKINHQKQLTQATIDGQERERREIGKEYSRRRYQRNDQHGIERCF
jgi:PAS domain S-box-containing protein